MILDVIFQENDKLFIADFDKVHDVSDGGYERGYTAGYEKGETDGHNVGYAEGLAARTYEVWTFTLTDGTVVNKEVTLL